MRQIEILAPAGSLESLYSALKLGADAVYTGTSRFGARAFAKNPAVEELVEALRYAHLRGKKIYLTVNTLLNDKELEEELYPLICPLYEAGLDACIVQDVGVLSFLHEYFPDMPLHASTQMTLLSGEEAELFRPYGVTRFVPGRELSIGEIREVRRQTGMEIEVFVHGALCYCYSGQCRMSEVIGGRSGNRGMCAQPCRLPWQIGGDGSSGGGRGHFMSTKDICTLFRIPELVEAGVDSFKIEGRMKQKEYSAFVPYLYRKYVTLYQKEGQEAFDALRENPDSELWRDYKKSQELYNRGGFSEGYLFEEEKKNIVYPQKNGHFGIPVGEVAACGRGQAQFVAKESLHYQDVLEFRGEDGVSAYEYTVKTGAEPGETVTARVRQGSHIYPGQRIYRRRNASLFAAIDRMVGEADDRYPLRGRFSGRIGEPVEFEVSGNGVTATVSGGVLQTAERQPMDEESLRRSLNALGNTNYRFEELTIQIPEQSFLPIGGIKKLRREAVFRWEQRACGTWGRTAPVRKNGEEGIRKERPLPAGDVPPDLRDWVGVASEEQLSTIVELCKKELLYILKLDAIPAFRWARAVECLGGKPFAIAFPKILRGRGRRVFERNWERHGTVFGKFCPEAVLVNSHRAYLYARAFFPDAVWYADENLYRENARAEAFYRQSGLYPSGKRNYGRVAVMETEGCIAVSAGFCREMVCAGATGASGQGGCGERRMFLRGPKGDEFVAVTHCAYGTNTIYTKEPQERAAGDTVWLDFTWESGYEVREVMREWNLL